MPDKGHEKRLAVLMIVLAAWAAAWAYSLVPLLHAVTGDDRFSRFLGWQAIAGIAAFASWAIGRGFPKGVGIRQIAAVPLGMALAIVIGLIGYLLLPG